MGAGSCPRATRARPRVPGQLQAEAVPRGRPARACERRRDFVEPIERQVPCRAPAVEGSRSPSNPTSVICSASSASPLIARSFIASTCMGRTGRSDRRRRRAAQTRTRRQWLTARSLAHRQDRSTSLTTSPGISAARSGRVLVHPYGAAKVRAAGDRRVASMRLCARRRFPSSGSRCSGRSCRADRYRRTRRCKHTRRPPRSRPLPRFVRVRRVEQESGKEGGQLEAR
jgi:hypothetical protein